MAAIPVRRASTEVQAIVHILRDTSYASEEDMAVAILKAAYEGWRQREWWTVGHFIGGRLLGFYGLEATEKAAAANGRKLGTGVAAPAAIKSMAAKEEEWMLADEQNILKYSDPPCVSCGHLQWQHGAVGFKGQKVKTPAGQRCSFGCSCPEYVRPDFIDLGV